MSVQQSQSAGDLGRLGALLFIALGRPKEQHSKITIAKDGHQALVNALLLNNFLGLLFLGGGAAAQSSEECP
jgi:hypothetical protein